MVLEGVAAAEGVVVDLEEEGRFRVLFLGRKIVEKRYNLK